MIRSFTLRDIPLVHRLGDQGTLFHTRSALTQDLWPLREALVNMFIGGQYPTYIWKDDNGAAVGFAQLHQVDDESTAHILCLGSAFSGEAQKDGSVVNTENLWIAFLEALIKKAGGRGIHNLIAEVNETGDELPVMRHAGFAVYTRQDIWKLSELPPRWVSPLQLTPAKSEDEWDISLLYSNVVPRLIQLVEPPPSSDDLEKVWLMHENGELSGFVVFTRGTAGTWIRLFVHPNSNARSEDIFRAAVSVYPPDEDHPVYVCVRRYQSWLQSGLQEVGFEQTGSQAMMVRHTVHHTKRMVPDLSKEVRKKAVAVKQTLNVED
ncbi:MAG: hypothetical protein AAF902_18290 [Chloroflexota bacterium]